MSTHHSSEVVNLHPYLKMAALATNAAFQFVTGNDTLHRISLVSGTTGKNYENGL
jgi:hypothetical protein